MRLFAFFGLQRTLILTGFHMPQGSSAHRTPGQLIEELLEQNQWTQKTLAIIVDVDVSIISKIVSGTRAIDAKLALALSEVFGIPAERLLELQQSLDLAQARLVMRADPGRQNRAKLFGKLPVAEMIKRGWLAVDNIRDVPKTEAALAQFFHAESSEQLDFPHAAKKTHADEAASPVQLAWFCRAKSIAKELLVGRYSPESVKKLVEDLRPLRASAEGVRKVPKALAEAGIRYLLIEALPGSKIDGVCFWLNDHAPVIAMSLRYDRIDNFWFVLRHELEHVIHLHGRETAIIDAELEGEKAGVGVGVPEEERIANAAAAEFCVPQRSMDSFVARKAPFFAERDLIGFARTLQIHPGLVAGQLQHRTKRYERFRNHLAKIRSVVAPSAIVDGWGDVYPLGE